MIRVASFNLNNLFDRFNFHASVDQSPRVTATYRWRLDASRDVLPAPAGPLTDENGNPLVTGGGPVRIEVSTQGQVVRPKPVDDLEALLIRTNLLNADVLAVQEVENIGALREFNSRLARRFDHVALVEGNDPRFIDVGVLSRLPIRRAISNRWQPDPADPGRFLFSRDVMGVEILNNTRTATLFTIWVGHLKSKFISPQTADPAAAQRRNDARRTRQAQGMHDVIEAHHNANDPFIVCGDFNDHPDSVTLAPLVNGNLNLRDIFHGGIQVNFENQNGAGPRITNAEDQPADENWTHRHSVSNQPDVYERFDQMLLSPALQPLQIAARIQRRTHWGKNHAGTDHDAVYVDLNLNP